ncbi:phosphate ABC transporter ATP-binding protein PstB [Peptostreptococcus faecalis]|uniref:phosphate ABC transporter ATP-binding protein PstB n=1 Tax=Peptostreptococcus faecalis TaxID=2045015 RepID=UPI000C7BA4B2|nr:phosphate ABC transporter ATP-binding protein PstB [Peptostreptococcus faecalis]
MENIIIESKDLDIYYGDFKAIKSANIAFEKNSVTALIGASGCGKSTFLRSINLMNREVKDCRLEGEILYKGENILREDIDIYDIRKNIGMVFQRPNPFNMSIYDNITFALKCHGIKDKTTLDEAVETSLQQAALWNDVKDNLKKSAIALSGGQQQRLCIARTLAMKPDVILLDEPTSALDPISTSKIEDMIFELQDNYTIIIVTHNMQQAARIADRTAFFHLGEIVEYDRTDIIFSNPAKRKTEDYITGRFG